MQGQARVGVLAKALGNPGRHQAFRTSLCFLCTAVRHVSLPALPGRASLELCKRPFTCRCRKSQSWGLWVSRVPRFLGQPSTGVEHCLEESGYPSASQPPRLWFCKATERRHLHSQGRDLERYWALWSPALAWATARLHPLSSAPQLSLKTALPVEAGNRSVRL